MRGLADAAGPALPFAGRSGTGRREPAGGPGPPHIYLNTEIYISETRILTRN